MTHNKIKNKYNLTSKLYNILDYPFETLRYKKISGKIWKLGNGRILDAGMGTGRNIPFYPKNSDIYGIDISNGMLDKSRKRAEKLKRNVHVQKMDIASTNFPDNYFDTIVATFLFCVMPDKLQPKALKEIKRICKSNGRIIMLGYEYSEKPFRRLFMKLLSPYVEFVYGARFDRKRIEYVKKENFKILENLYVHQDIMRMIVIQP
ncbi:MAG TPA: class I SAM-dependent methyltransferase [Candidatus Scalindua sp.]|nr:class I SAM-dependent methyltransferase [Candidatus Scalindua sp.]